MIWNIGLAFPESPTTMIGEVNKRERDGEGLRTNDCVIVSWNDGRGSGTVSKGGHDHNGDESSLQQDVLGEGMVWNQTKGDEFEGPRATVR